VRIGAPIGAASAAPTDDTGISLLVPTSTWPHKLTTQAIAWLQRWADENHFTGAVHGYGSLPPDCRWPQREGWIHHGRISDDSLRPLENANATLVYFSAYEGYGLPPVEAAAAGRRAIASDLPPLRETIPRECLFDNGDYGSFAQTLSRALNSPAKRPLVVETGHDVARRWLATLHDAGAFEVETATLRRHA
jgi:glycosyltransferase involved in cell wall biosynthesis